MVPQDQIHILVLKIASGDGEAFEQLFISQRDIIAKKIRRYTKCPEDAEDICQKVAIRMYQKIGSLVHPEAFSSWLNTIVIHECRRHFHKMDPATSIEELPEYTNMLVETDTDYLPTEHTEQTELKAGVWDMLNRMPKTTRRVIIMYYEYGMRYREIAKLLGTTVGTVCSIMHRARKRLRKELHQF